MRTDQGISGIELRTRHNEEVRDLKRKLRSTEAILEEYKSEHGSLTTLFGAIKDSIEALPQGKIKYESPKLGKKVESPCVACFLICDTHYGAVQVASEIEGFGEFSSEICERRSMQFVDNGIRWVDVTRSGYRIDNAVVLVVGDLVSGDIHRELSVTNAFPVPVQTVRSARLLANQISRLSEHFKDVTVHFVSEDNHGRLTVKPQAKEAGLNSFNYILGEMAKLMLANHKNVTFNIYPQYEAVVNVCGRRYLIMHGHNVKGWMSIPLYGIERKAAREAVKRMNAPDRTKFHKIVMGHWHSPFQSALYVIGGSVSGTDAYDHQAGRHADPSQKAWLIHPKHGEFDWTDFLLQ